MKSDPFGASEKHLSVEMVQLTIERLETKGFRRLLFCFVLSVIVNLLGYNLNEGSHPHNTIDPSHSNRKYFFLMAKC